MKISAAGNEITVTTGEIRYASAPAVLSSVGIGSCILLFLYDPKLKIGGVAHIMLPENDGKSESAGLYADTGVSTLICELEHLGSHVSQLRAKIVGGANLFTWSSVPELKDLGKFNIDRVRKELIKKKVYIAVEEIGGTDGKKVSCCLSTGKVFIIHKNQIEKII